MFKRPIYKAVLARLQEPRTFLQVLAGPRQVGKTTLILQIKDALNTQSHYASTDDPTLQNLLWIEQQWQIARILANEHGSALLILDEIQKIPNWSDTIKLLWDEDSRNHIQVKVIILGSSTLLIQKGLSDSMAGRFEISHIAHWSFAECEEAFGWNVNQYIFFGGYPGSASLIHNEQRWKRYIVDSLIETSISRDIMLMTQVNKPALLRQTFELSCNYSGQILSYQKMLGQLHEAGNTTTLAHYLKLLSEAGLVTGLEKYASESFRQKASSPKLQVLNNALLSSQKSITFEQAMKDGELWGRLVESSVGAHLINSARGTNIRIFYWREGNKEVDFVVKLDDKLVAIEVKSTLKQTSLPGIAIFAKNFPMTSTLLVGGQGIPVEDFLRKPVEYWIQNTL